MESFRLIRGYSFLAFVAMIAGRISFSTSSIIIGAFLTPEYITYFIIAARLTDYVKSALRSITTVLTPAISSLEALGTPRGDSARLAERLSLGGSVHYSFRSRTHRAGKAFS